MTWGISVGLFNRKKPEAASAMKAPEHAVIVHFKLSDDQHGTVEERESVFALEDELEQAIESMTAGEFDGNEFGGGEAVLYAYGPDADALFAAMEAPLRAFPARPAFAILRYGEAADATAAEVEWSSEPPQDHPRRRAVRARSWREQVASGTATLRACG